MLRANPGSTLGVSAVVLCTIAVLGVLARLPLIGDPRWTPTADRDSLQVAVALGLYPAGTFLVMIVWMLASIAVTAIGSIVAIRHLAGERTPLRLAWRQARPRLAAALGLGVLDVVVVLAPIVGAAALAIALAVRAGPESARLTTTALFAVAAVAVLAVLPTLVIAGPMLVLEKLRPVDALWRAVALQRRGYWRLLGRVACTYLLLSVVSTVVSLPFSLAAGVSGPGEDIASQTVASLLLSTVGWVIGQVCVLPFLIVTNAQFYADQVARCGTSVTT
ncbi:Uncharacterised protein [Tsukamurella tyrosinosolvens]|uniref:Membrane domain of glycerophosphoryl diester phosphodiesterase n=2 Tax=Tsukamurella tyrosinosolvens TaxID=57704 RepID=A0A1H4LUZ3_TSUTY|nr:hypothetical protein [Tsukamurella tyrosinosolvens]AUN39010.1 hypothetical protein ASU32_02440 [Tsukamurella tyrosinosolvens]KXO96721.1 hypothetical protein AXK58_05380 [Tsukamurella tyrosinosolvens]QRY85742.1 hypothetical protein JVY00_06635 [Tsukamurella tyrosinosolvens]SEB74334.1 hypothetical protein SAMN04489793_0699 [Tsukamurella tyrosinosolvens]VEH88543.1 Uncharacterised protein [Tsukamurella tyrosinosolvens]